MIFRSLMAAVLSLALIGCGAVDRALDEARSADTSDDGYSDPAARSGSVEFDPAIGWRITGPDGTTLEVTDNLTLDGNTTQLNTGNTYTISDGERLFLYTAFVDEASVEVTVTAGGPVLFELLSANAVEGGEFGEVNIIEVVDSVEITEGNTAELAGLRPQP